MKSTIKKIYKNYVYQQITPKKQINKKHITSYKMKHKSRLQACKRQIVLILCQQLYYLKQVIVVQGL